LIFSVFTKNAESFLITQIAEDPKYKKGPIQAQTRIEFFSSLSRFVYKTYFTHIVVCSVFIANESLLNRSLVQYCLIGLTIPKL
jgi:hypothetical protein